MRPAFRNPDVRFGQRYEHYFHRESHHFRIFRGAKMGSLAM
jgi:hypothetical protein